MPRAAAPEDVTDVLVGHFGYHIHNVSDAMVLVRDDRILIIPIGVPELKKHQIEHLLTRALDPPAHFTMDQFWAKLTEHID